MSTIRILKPETIAAVSKALGQTAVEVYRVPGSSTSTYQAIGSDGLGYELPKALDAEPVRCPARDRKVKAVA